MSVLGGGGEDAATGAPARPAVRNWNDSRMLLGEALLLGRAQAADAARAPPLTPRKRLRAALAAAAAGCAQLARRPARAPSAATRLPTRALSSAAGAAADALPPEAAPPPPPAAAPAPRSGWAAALPVATWGLNVTITVMAVWLVGFWAAAYSLVPALLATAGVGPPAAGAASAAAQAARHLLLDLSQLALTAALLARALRGHAPRAAGLFALRLRPLRSWLPTAAAGAAAFPLIDALHKALVALLSLEAPGGAAGAGGALAAAGGPAARAMWVAVLVLCAPLWEELMFRGFLLPALARRAPPAAAVILSALAFALVHFSREGFLPLLALGCVFGAAYARTGNLAAPVALHAGWNVYLLVQVL
jgi:membrane protease YdiL (CAAX protease family)